MARTVTAHALVPVFSILLLSACGGGSSGGSSPPDMQNQPPIAAVAGPAKESAFAGASVILDASTASDADGSIAGILWEQLGDPTVEITDPSTPVLEFIAPAVTEDTVLTFRVAVTDDDGATTTEEIRLLIHAVLPGNQSPDAVTLGDLVVRSGDAVQLDARGSTDADGSITGYAWTQIAGDPVVVGDAASAIATFTAPSGEGVLQFRVVVTDNEGVTDSDVVVVRSVAANANQPPFADIVELANSVPEGTGFSLDGGSSLDPEIVPLEFQWTVPAGFTVGGESASTSRLQLTGTPDVKADTSYMFILVVSDGQFTASTATAVVVEAVNHPPAVTIQADPPGIVQTGVAEGTSATLHAVATDPDEQTVSRYSWQQLDGDETLNLAGVTGPDLVFEAPDVGPSGDRYAFQVTVEDSEGATASATIAFNVNFVNRAPVAVLVAERTEAAEGTSVLLDARDSSDPDEQTLVFTWTQIDVNDMPGASIADNGDGTAMATMPGIGPSQDNGLLRFRVTVNDGHNAQNSEKFADVDIVVRFVNQLPELRSISASRNAVDEGTLSPAVTLNVDAFDPDGGALTYEWLVPAGFLAGGRQTSTLSLSRTPDVGPVALPFTFHVDVRDPNGGVKTFSIPLTVNFDNRLPEADAGPDLQVPENTDLVAQEFRLDGRGSRDIDADIGHQELTYTWEVSDVGLVLDDARAVRPRIVAVPDVTALQPAQRHIPVTLRVSDGVTEDTAITTVIVEFVNQPPSVDDIEGPESVVEGNGFELTANGHDDDGQGVRYVWTVPFGFAIDPASRFRQTLTVTDTPDVTAANAGPGITGTFGVVAIDTLEADSEPRPYPVSVTFLNQVPRISSVTGDNSINEQTADHQLRANGFDGDGHFLQYTWTRSSQDVSGIPDNALGVQFPFTGRELVFDAPDVGDNATVVFDVTASDGLAPSESFTFAVEINKDGGVPVINGVAPFADSIAEGAGHAFTLTVDATDNLDDPAELDYRWTPHPDFTTRVDVDAPHVLVIEATPGVGPAGGNYAFHVDVTDTDANSVGRDINVQVDFVNQQPVINNITVPDNVREGDPVTLQVAAEDDDGQILAYQWNQVTEEDIGELAVDGEGTATFTAPAVGPDDNLELIFTVTVDDQSDAENATFTSAQHSVIIDFVNQAPVIGEFAVTRDVNEQTPVTLAVPATDTDGQEVTFVWLQDPDDVEDVDLTNVDGVGNPTFMSPVADEPVDLHFTVTARDGEGPDALTATANLTVTVNHVNDPPVIGEITMPAGISEDSDPATVEATITVPVTDETPAEQLIFTWDVPPEFVVTGEGSNVLQIIKTPNVTANTPYTFGVQVDDGEGGVAERTGLSLTVNFINQVPQISLAAAESPVDEGSAVDLTVTASDNDLHELTYTWEQLVGEGEAVIIEPITGVIGAEGNGVATFTAPDVTGVDFIDLRFSVEVSDGIGGVAIGEEVTVSVNRVNEDPANVQIDAQGPTTVQEGAISITLTPSATDDMPVEGLSYSWSGHEDFTSTLNGNALNLTATPDVTAIQQYPITVTVEDEELGSTTTSLTVTVQFVNQDPEVSIVTTSHSDLVNSGANERSPVTLTADGTDDDGHPITYRWSSTPDMGFDGTTGSELNFTTPDLAGGNQQVAVQVVADDGNGGSATNSVTFDVIDLGDASSVTIQPEPVGLATNGVYGGYPVILSAVTQNLTSPTFQWSRVDADALDLEISGTTQSIGFTAPEVTGDANIIVRVDASGQGDEVAANAQLGFTIKRRPAGTPLPFTFVDLNDVPASLTSTARMVFDSNPIVIGGLGETAQITITGGTYSMDGGASFTEDPGTVSNGTNIIVRVQGPVADGETVSATLTVGEASDTFDVTAIHSGFTAQGIPGGVRVSWESMQGSGGYNVYRTPGGSTTNRLTNPALGGESTQFDFHGNVWNMAWGESQSDRFDLRAIDAADAEREVLGSRQVLTQAESLNAITYVKSDDPLTGGAFGNAIAVSNDGAIMVVGAPEEGNSETERTGHVVVYQKLDHQWSHAQTLPGLTTGDRFGAAVALSGDGSVLAVGAPGSNLFGSSDDGQVYVYRREGDGQYAASGNLRPIGDSTAGEEFGTALAISNDGNVIAVGVPLDPSDDPADPNSSGAAGSGAVYIYRYVTDEWMLEQRLKEATPTAGNRFGTAVALSPQSNNTSHRLFASRMGGGATIFIYDRGGDAFWSPSTQVGSNVQHSSSGYGGNLSVARTNFYGRRFVSGGVLHRLNTDNTWFTIDIMSGSPSSRPAMAPISSAISPPGTIVAFGINGQGTPPGSGIYRSAPSGSTDSAGAIYLYNFIGAGPSFVKFLKAPNPDDDDDFGKCLVFENHLFDQLSARLFACAPGEDSAGVDGIPVEPDARDDNTEPDSGAVYIY